MKRILLAILVFIPALLAFLFWAQVSSAVNLFTENFESGQSVTSNGGTIEGVANFVAGADGSAVDFAGGGRVYYPQQGKINPSEGRVQFQYKPAQIWGGLLDYGLLGTPDSMGVFTNNALWAEYRISSEYYQVSTPLDLTLPTWHKVVFAWKCQPGATTNFISIKVDNLPASSRIIGQNCINPSATDRLYVGYDEFYKYSNGSFDQMSIYDSVSEPASTKVQSTGAVKVQGRQLFVDNSPFFVKSVGYQPTPIGLHPNESDMYCQPEIYNRDIALIRDMGANTIRTWRKVDCLSGSANTNFLNALYNNGDRPIRVIMGFWVDWGADITNPAVREAIKGEFRTYVARYKNHPAVLTWAIGNENNYHVASGNWDELYSLYNEMAQVAYEEEGGIYHPVTIVNGEISQVGNSVYGADDNSLNMVDIWGANIYRGVSFGTLFSEYPAKSLKPLLITEYGHDSYDVRSCSVGEPEQKQWDVNLFTQAQNNSAVTVGASLMEYSDEFWKSNRSLDSCPPSLGNTNGVQDNGGVFLNVFDNFGNEEFWGIVKIEKTQDGPDKVAKREVYCGLMIAFGNTDSDGDCVADVSDNCVNVANPNQENFNSEIVDLGDGFKFDDYTYIDGDSEGDLCDSDIDGDDLSNSEEASLSINDKNMDTDSDSFVDSAEVRCGSDPKIATSTPRRPAGVNLVDSDGDLLPDACEAVYGTNPNSRFSDSDSLVDGVEVLRLASDPLSVDTDLDNCSDDVEVSSLNQDKVVNSGDQLALAKLVVTKSSDSRYVRDVDINADGTINSGDQLLLALNFAESCI